MGAVTSKVGSGLGVAICLGAGVVLGVLQHGELDEESVQRKLKESERESAAAQMELEAARTMKEQLKKSQHEAGALQTQLAAARAEVQENTAALVQHLARAESEELQNQGSQHHAQALAEELEATRKELEEARQGAISSEAAQHDLVDQVIALKSERDDYEDSMHQVKSLQVELDATRKVATGFNKKTQQELESTRGQLEPLRAERDAMVKTNSETQRQLKALEKEQDQLQRELAQSRQKRKQSLSDLSHISTKLETVGTSWSPWNDINAIKGSVERMRSASREEVEQLRGA